MEWLFLIAIVVFWIGMILLASAVAGTFLMLLGLGVIVCRSYLACKAAGATGPRPPPGAP